MTRKEAEAIAGGLSNPSKMPCHGYSIPAQRCQVGAKLVRVAGSTCSGCYALRNFYNMPNVRASLEARYQSLQDPRWEDALVTMIQATGEEYFRWHDSGDLQSVEHLVRIVRVCERTAKVKHWLPTREYKIVQDYLRKFGKFPKNLVVRLSAHMVDQRPPVYGLPTSTVHSFDRRNPLQVLNEIPGKTHFCPTQEQGNKCGECRACWDKRVKNVSYHKH